MKKLLFLALLPLSVFAQPITLENTQINNCEFNSIELTQQGLSVKCGPRLIDPNVQGANVCPHTYRTPNKTKVVGTTVVNNQQSVANYIATTFVQHPLAIGETLAVPFVLRSHEALFFSVFPRVQNDALRNVSISKCAGDFTTQTPVPTIINNSVLGFVPNSCVKTVAAYTPILTALKGSTTAQTLQDLCILEANTIYWLNIKNVDSIASDIRIKTQVVPR